MSKPDSIDQLIAVLARHVDNNIWAWVLSQMAAYRQDNVTGRYLYAVLSDFLPNTANGNYYPIRYLASINGIH